MSASLEDTADRGSESVDAFVWQPHPLPPGSKTRIHQLLSLAEDKEALRTRRETLVGQLTVAMREDDDALFAVLDEERQSWEIPYDLPAIAAEAMWAAHFFPEGIDDPSPERICEHFYRLSALYGEQMEPGFASELLGIVQGAEQKPGGFLETLGRLKAIDTLLDEENEGDLPLLYDEVSRATGGAPYLDLATGPGVHEPLGALRRLPAGSPASPLILNDASTFVHGQFRETCVIEGVTPDRASFLRGDAKKVLQSLPAGSMGAIHCCHIATWTCDDSPDWYDAVVTRVRPQQGKLIVTIKGEYGDLVMPERHDADALALIERKLRETERDCGMTNIAMAKRFHSLLCGQGRHGSWDFAMKFFRSENTPVSRLSCVFTRST